MCGIVGYVGDNQAAPLLLHRLSKLEYRGYDSAGIAVWEVGSENIQIIKAKGSMVIIIQSGETVDSIAALCLSKEEGVSVLGIVNVVGSSIARESAYVLYTYAGPEIAVATTKAYSTQLIVSYLLVVQAGYVQEVIAEE